MDWRGGVALPRDRRSTSDNFRFLYGRARLRLGEARDALLRDPVSHVQ
jgi:hypothetical protein